MRTLIFFTNQAANGSSRTIETQAGSYGGVDGVQVKASISGAGAVSATVAFYGSDSRSNSGGVLLSTLSLTGTGTNTQGASVARWPYMYAVLTSISGTGAIVSASASE